MLNKENIDRSILAAISGALTIVNILSYSENASMAESAKIEAARDDAYAKSFESLGLDSSELRNIEAHNQEVSNWADRLKSLNLVGVAATGISCLAYSSLVLISVARKKKII